MKKEEKLLHSNKRERKEKEAHKKVSGGVTVGRSVQHPFAAEGEGREGLWRRRRHLQQKERREEKDHVKQIPGLKERGGRGKARGSCWGRTSLDDNRPSWMLHSYRDKGGGLDARPT